MSVLRFSSNVEMLMPVISVTFLNMVALDILKDVHVSRKCLVSSGTISCYSYKLVVCHVSVQWAQVHSQHSYVSHSIMIIVVVHKPVLW